MTTTPTLARRAFSAALALTALTVVAPTPRAAAAAGTLGAGASCPKRALGRTNAGFTCTRVGGKYIWAAKSTDTTAVG